MNETPTRTWLKEVETLLEELQPVLQQNIRTLKHDLKPEGDLLKNLLQTEIEKQEAIVERIEESKNRLKFLIYDPDPKKPDEPIEHELEDDTGFIVSMPNGKKIGCTNASDTYSKTLIELGITRVMEKVKDLKLCKNGIPLVDTHKHHKYIDNHPRHDLKRAYTPYIYEHEGETYYIFTSMSNPDKEKLLLKIAKLLSETLEIDRPENAELHSG